MRVLSTRSSPGNDAKSALRTHCHTTLFTESEGRGKRHTQDLRGVLGMIAEPTVTDGCRLLCHQFSPSSLFLLAHCISRCNRCSLTMKHRTPTILRSLANGDQGQSTRNTAYPKKHNRTGTVPLIEA